MEVKKKGGRDRSIYTYSVMFYKRQREREKRRENKS